MDGFYTKIEASRILGVSGRQINYLIAEGRLRRILHGRKAWIPKSDVQAAYDGARSGLSIGPEQVQELLGRMEKLENEVEVLKLGLGFGRRNKPRPETDLLLLRQRSVDLLSLQAWTNKQVSEFADELVSLQEDEAHTLIKSSGPAALLPFSELAIQMLRFLERHPNYPEKGLDVLHARMSKAKDRFYGLVHITSKAPGISPQRQGKTARQALEIPPNVIEDHVLSYIRTVLGK